MGLELEHRWKEILGQPQPIDQEIVPLTCLPNSGFIQLYRQLLPRCNAYLRKSPFAIIPFEII